MNALSNLKILDFSTLLPGPYATLTMADMGADVVSIVAPGRRDLVTEWGPEVAPGLSASAAWLGRGKRSIFLNLKKPSALEAVRRLILDGGYDIILEQFRPGVMKKLGLDYETLREICPGLIYCSLTGYGQTGPLASRAGHDINYLARSGNMAASGRSANGPALYNMQIADVAVGSMNTVVSILAAVNYRSLTGKGQYIDVSMLDGLVPFHAMDGASFLAGAAAPAREAQALNGGGVYDFYQTSDGGYLSVGSLEPQFFANLCRGLDLPETADKAAIRQRFLEHPRAYWEQVFADLDACVEPVIEFDELVSDPQLCARGMFPKVPLGGETVQQLGCPLKLSKCPPEYRHVGVVPGTNTVEILSTMGFSAAEIDEISK